MSRAPAAAAKNTRTAAAEWRDLGLGRVFEPAMLGRCLRGNRSGLPVPPGIRSMTTSEDNF
jgi:hypothetical protein